MPVYDFRCKTCGEDFTKFYKSYKNYEAATIICPNCQSDDLSRVIDSVNVAAMTRDYSKMNANEMLSVLESGDKQQVNEMYKQVGGSANPANAVDLHNQVQKQTKPSHDAKS